MPPIHRNPEVVAKRQRLLQAAVGTKVSLKELTKILSSLGHGPEEIGDMGRNLTNHLDIQTPLGPLLVKLDVPLEDGGVHTWTVAAPGPWLYILCQRSNAFSKLLQNSLVAGRPAGIVLYADETTPGNQMRPDDARETLCIHWTIKELPSWQRSRAHGWNPFGFLKSSVVDNIAGGLSALWVIILKFFFTGLLSFATGMRLPTPSGGHFLFQAIFACFLADEKAHKESWGVKGASGWKFCLHCRNIMKCDLELIEGEAYFFHTSVATPKDFHLHTPASFEAMVDKLNANIGVLDPTAFGNLEKCLGLSHNPLGILWDPICQHICNPVTHVYWDWQHCVAGSGGVAQFELNAFVLELGRHGVEPEELDALQQTIHWPRQSRKCLSTDFFQTRVVSKADKHVRAFASEVLSALQVLMLFIDLVLSKCGFMGKHAECLRLLCLIISLLSSETCFEQVGLLRRLVLAHHKLYVELYGLVLASKPKLHYLFHIVDCIARHGLCLSCFAPERKHKETNQFGRSGAGPHLGTTILKRCLHDSLAALSNEDVHREFYLHQPSRVRELDSFLQACLPEAGDMNVSFEMTGPAGRVHKGDLCASSVDGCASFGSVEFFACPASPSGAQCYVLLRRCQRTAPGVWKLLDDVVLLGATELGEPVPFVEVAEGLRPLHIKV